MIYGFTFYGNYYEAITQGLGEDEQGEVYKAIMDYAFAEKMPKLTGAALMAFKLIQPTIDASIKRREASRANGLKGGRPAKKKPTQNLTQNLSETYDKGKVKVKVKVKVNSITAKAVIQAYNEICVSLPKVQKVTDARLKHVKARLQDHTLEEIKSAFIIAERSDFLTGKKTSWRADFDWLMKENNLVKVIEGNYTDTKPDGYQKDYNDIAAGSDPAALEEARRVLQ